FIPVVMLGDTSTIQLAAEMTGTDIARLKEGQEAIATIDSLPGLEMKGRVKRLPVGTGAGKAAGPQQETSPTSVLITLESTPPAVRVGVLAQFTIVTQAKE